MRPTLTRILSLAALAAVLCASWLALDGGDGRAGAGPVRERPGPADNRRSAPARELSALHAPISRPRRGDPRAIAESWLRANGRALGWSFARQRRSLALTQRVRSAGGSTVLRWAQRVGGATVVDGDVRMLVSRRGEILKVSSTLAPVSRREVRGPVVPAQRARAVLSRRAAIEDLDLVALTRPRTRLAYQFVERGPDGRAQVRVDARTLREIDRSALVRHAEAEEPRRPRANAFRLFPTKADGSDRRLEEIPDGWLTLGNRRRLEDGGRVWVFPDYDDNHIVNEDEHVELDGDVFDGGRRGFTVPDRACHPVSLCAWNPFDPATRTVNGRSSSINAFVQANRFVDHLRRPPFSWTANGRGGPSETDRIRVRVAVGSRLRNSGVEAESFTRPAGRGAEVDLGLMFGSDAHAYYADAAEQADFIAHELAHVYFNRRHTGPSGWGDRDLRHVSAIHEGLADALAADWTIAAGYRQDDPTKVDVVFGIGSNDLGERRSALDCPPVPAAPRSAGDDAPPPPPCDDKRTFGHFGTDGYEAHRTGEIMSGALWRLRTLLVAGRGDAAGAERWRELVAGMVDALPYEPTFLDVRDTLLLVAHEAPDDQQRIWRAYADFGMGFAAEAPDGDAVAVEASDRMPPTGSVAVVTGLVRDSERVGGVRFPLAGALVRLIPGPAYAGTSGAPSSPFLARTDAAGRFRLEVPAAADDVAGRLRVTATGYAPEAVAATLAPGGTTTHDIALRRDWAAPNPADPARGGTIDPSTPDGMDARDCDASMAIGDRTHSYTTNRSSLPAQYPILTVRLPEPKDITSIGIDPRARCTTTRGNAERDTATTVVKITTVDAAGNEVLAVPLTRVGAGDRSASEALEELTPAAGASLDVVKVRVHLVSGTSGTIRSLNQLRVFSSRNPRPVARAAGQQQAAAGEVVRFSASGSTCGSASAADEPLERCRVAWDLDGDGDFGDRDHAGQVADGVAVETIFRRPGVHEVCVKLVDEETGENDADCTTIIVRGAEIFAIEAGG